MKKFNLAVCLFLLTACASGTKSNQNIDVKEAVDAAYATVLEENKVATMEMDKATVISYFGLDESLIEDAYGIGPMMSTHVDMIVAIKATKGNGEMVEDVVETFQDNLERDSMTYPMNLAAISEAEVFSEGNYVYYVRLNTYTSDDLSDEKKAEVIEQINDKAENAIEALYK